MVTVRLTASWGKRTMEASPLKGDPGITTSGGVSWCSIHIEGTFSRAARI